MGLYYKNNRENIAILDRSLIYCLQKTITDTLVSSNIINTRGLELLFNSHFFCIVCIQFITMKTNI